MKTETKNNGCIFWSALITSCIFLVLKLTHVIDWSWWLIALPLLVCAGLIVLVLIAAFVFALMKFAEKDKE